MKKHCRGSKCWLIKDNKNQLWGKSRLFLLSMINWHTIYDQYAWLYLTTYDVSVHGISCSWQLVESRPGQNCFLNAFSTSKRLRDFPYWNIAMKTKFHSWKLQAFLNANACLSSTLLIDMYSGMELFWGVYISKHCWRVPLKTVRVS